MTFSNFLIRILDFVRRGFARCVWFVCNLGEVSADCQNRWFRAVTPLDVWMTLIPPSAVHSALRRVEEETPEDHVAHRVEHAIHSSDKADQPRKIAELMEVVGRVDG